MPTTNEELRSLILRHEIRTRRFSKSVVRRIVSLLKQSNQAARDRLAARLARQIDTGPWTTAHVEAVVRDLESEIHNWRLQAEPVVQDELSAFAVYETAWQAGVINQASPIEFNITKPTTELVRAAAMSQPFQGRLMAEWFDDTERAQVRAMAQAVRVGAVQGLGIRAIAKQVREAGDMGQRHAETIARTAIATITNKARDETYKANTDIIKEVQWVSTLDGRTSVQCRALDGKRFAVDEGPRPPIHPNCRSVIIPITKSWRELGFDNLGEEESVGKRPFVADTRKVKDIPKDERDQLIGQAPSDTTYNEWLKTQPREFVEEVLGESKAALYLDGKLPLDRFVDDTLHPLTLDELKRREPSAWKRAGLGQAA